MSWVEVKALEEMLPWLYQEKCESIHHFYEPWWENGPVVRLQNPKPDLNQPAWDASPDEELYGEIWPEVKAYFEASSRLALVIEAHDRPEWLRRKLIHCTLNCWGLSVWGEARFALRFAWGRLRMLIHDVLHPYPCRCH